FVHHDHGNLGFDYHVEHHHRPARHWTWYYEEHARLAKHAKHPAVLIEKEKFRPLAFMAALGRKDYRVIGRNAHVQAVPRGNAEVMQRVLAERARPIGAAERKGALADIDAVVSRAMAAALPKSFAI